MKKTDETRYLHATCSLRSASSRDIVVPPPNALSHSLVPFANVGACAELYMTRLHTTGCNGQPGTCTLTLAGRIGTTKFSREKRRDRSVHQRQNEPSTNPSPKIRIPALRSSKLLWDEGYLVLAAVLGSLNELSFKTPFSVRRKTRRNSVGGASKEGKTTTFGAGPNMGTTRNRRKT